MSSIDLLKIRELRGRGGWLAIGIKRYALAEGELPATLSDLEPKCMEHIPSEPFYGRSFDYVKTGDKGVISFPSPGSDYVFTFRVYARRHEAPNQRQDAGSVQGASTPRL